MSARPEIARRIAALFSSRFLRGYVASKLASDPLYPAVAEQLRDHGHAILDLGCGVGLMEFYLRESGFTEPIAGIDHDGKKIEVARNLAGRYADLEFQCRDFRGSLPGGRSVLLLDVLHYFHDGARDEFLRAVAASIPAGGMAVVRTALRDGTWRYRLTWLEESFARLNGWLRAERLSFPTREQIESPFRERGFETESSPLWGRTPFNNYLFVFRRPSSGTTKE